MRLADVLTWPDVELRAIAAVYGLDVLVERCDGDRETQRWRLTYKSSVGAVRVVVGDSGATSSHPGVGHCLARFITRALFELGLPCAVRVLQAVLDELGDAAELAPEAAALTPIVEPLRTLAGAGRRQRFVAEPLPAGPERVHPWVTFALRWGLDIKPGDDEWPYLTKGCRLFEYSPPGFDPLPTEVYADIEWDLQVAGGGPRVKKWAIGKRVERAELYLRKLAGHPSVAANARPGIIDLAEHAAAARFRLGQQTIGGGE